jgi:hypothetical protein
MLRVKEQRVKGGGIEGVGQFQNCRGGFFSGSLMYLLHLSLGREDPGWPRLPIQEAQRFKT